MNFESIKLPRQIVAALKSQNIENPTLIQELAIPPALAGKDIIGIAQTGTGKTLAFLLPILRDLKFSKQTTPRILILVPTRELVEQICEEIAKLTDHISLRVVPIYGGKNINTQKQIIHEGSDIIVATPGRVYDLALTGVLKFRDIQKLVIDECDEMLNLGFKPQIQRILELLPDKRQNFMFSATMSKDVDELVKNFFNQTERILATKAGYPLENIFQKAVLIENFYTKINYLKHFLNTTENINNIFIFVNTKAKADKLQEMLQEEFEFYFGVIHSNKSQNLRNRTIEDLRDGVFKGIIATDVAARGIDIPDVSHVINFEIPEQPELYIHRIGRTGRQQKNGTAISLCTEKEIQDFEIIQSFMDKKVELEKMPSTIAVSEQLLTEEEEVNIHDAPTLMNAGSSVEIKKQPTKKETKTKNYSPAEKRKLTKNKRKRRRK